VEVVVIGFYGFWVWLWVDHDRFGGMERAWLSVVGGVVCIASTGFTCCDVVLALWIEHGRRMREVRFKGSGDHEDQVRVEEGRMEGKGQRSSRVAQRSRPGYAQGTPRLLRGKGMVLSEGDVVASRQVFKRRWKGPLLEREKIGTKKKQM
jgi:hypothetical protein